MTSPIRDIDEQQFEEAVIHRSAEVPVVVDFWAAWCAPCRALAPILEAGVQAMEGRVELVKVDTDRAQSLAARFGIRGIPAVKAFRDGGVVAEFEGARDARFVRAFLEQVAPSEARRALERAAAALRLGHGAEVEEALRPHLDDPQVGPTAKLTLAQAWIARGAPPQEVEGLLGQIPPRSPEADAVPSLRMRLSFVKDSQDYGGEERARQVLAQSPGDLEARYALACALAARGALPEALEELLQVAAANRRFRDDGARRAMLAIFDQLGPDSAVARDFRRRLMVVL